MFDSVIPQTAARQTPLSMGFFRQEYWNGLPFPSPGDLPNPGIKLEFPALAGDSFCSATREAQSFVKTKILPVVMLLVVS